MFGSRPKLIDILRQRERDERGPVPEALTDLHEPAAHTFHDDGTFYALALRKRRNEGLLKKMLTEGGYGDLAKSVAIRKQHMEDSGHE